jgi:hypothetical protein
MKAATIIGAGSFKWDIVDFRYTKKKVPAARILRVT